MTWQYLAGELSVRLFELQEVACAYASEFARLRREAETAPAPALGSVVRRALGLADRVCWDSLMRGDTRQFASQATRCAELWSFAVCAGLVEDSWSRGPSS